MLTLYANPSILTSLYQTLYPNLSILNPPILPPAPPPGTGTVVVRLADVNDNSPRLTRQLWQLEADETWGAGPVDNSTLLEITAADPDAVNYFFYRVGSYLCLY